MKTRRSKTLVTLIALLFFWGAVAVWNVFAVDPFYEHLLRKGQAAYDRGQYAEAGRVLRLACFGMLDEPPLLAKCLVHLALAQDAARDPEAFRETFVRILEGEDRFGAYTKADLAPELRAKFEAAAARLVPPQTLRATATFAHLVPSREERVAALPPRERRRELEAKVKAEPDAVSWKLMLAELDLAEGRYKAGARLLEEVLAKDAKNAQALKLRGKLYAAEKRWGEAEKDFRNSGLAATDRDVALGLLESLGQQGKWRELEATLRELPPSLAQDKAVAFWQRELEKSRSEEASAKSAQKGQVSEAQIPAKPTPAPSGPSPDELARLKDLWTKGRVQDAQLLAEKLLERYPKSRQAQLAAAEAAYRAADWKMAVERYRMVGTLSEPEHQFYLAVALYETGSKEEAATVLRGCLDQLKQTPYVRNYAAKILAEGK